MRIISVILISLGILFGIFGFRSYLRDDRYVKASVVVKASVISAKVEPNPWKNVDHVRLVLLYMRDGVTDSIENNYTDVYSKDELRTSEEELKAATHYVRYVPKEKRSKNIPNWVMVNSNGEFEGFYGCSSFGQMFSFILLGFMVRRFGRKKSI
jgi:hypothetical protein